MRKASPKRLKYFTPQELKTSARAEAHSALTEHIGQGSIKGLEILEKYKDYWPNKKENLRILDCGTASGQFTLELKNLGFENISAVDFDDYRSPESKQENSIENFKTGDLSTEPLPWPDDSFDIITAWCVLPHLENPFHFFREVRRALTSNGLFFFSAPHISSLMARKRFLKTGEVERYGEQNNHLVAFPEAIVKKMVANHFEILGTEYYIERKKLRHSRLGFFKLLGTEKKWFGQKRFQSWFGNDIFYILKKK
ncbi:MAG: class I SAM-dependent methyltransferase [Candidatus Paceibacterota bacterium]|jgi:SAM-dependent methyltransferase